VFVDRPETAIGGLVELMDNNPMVCADEVSVPSPPGTLALLAIGPLALAGLLVEPPALMVAAPEDAGLERWLCTAEWSLGASTHFDAPSDTAVGIKAVACITTPEDWSDLDALFEERYGSSFFVERVDDEWTERLPPGWPSARYRLRCAPGDDQSLLSIEVGADLHGKCGAAQVVHAMNVMAGFEESLPFR
jgi:N-acetyl-gamma-glutamylphosphate reductase